MATPKRNSNNRYIRQQQQLENRLAGLQLREEAQAEQAAANDAREAASAERIALDRQRQLFEQEKYVTQERLKFKAREQSIKYQRALSTLDESDPDFFIHLNAMDSAFPLATYDPELQEIRKMKAGAHAKVRESILATEKEAGVSPWSAGYLVRDEAGRYRGVRWDKFAQDLQSRRMAAATAATQQLPLGGSVNVELQPGVKIAGQVPTVAGAIAETPGAVTPEQAKLLINKDDPVQAVQEIAVGAAGQAAKKQEQQGARAKLDAIKAKIAGITAGGKVFGPEKDTLNALQAELDSLIPAEQPKEDKLKGYRDLLK